jgi:hypothetical protein
MEDSSHKWRRYTSSWWISKTLILIAPTGWGKSVVFQAVPALSGGIGIMIMPLTLLEEDQVSLPILDSYWDILPDMFYAGQINI